ncbi:MAG: HlyD family efflux transporter periplasmic adaptor subunit [Planctomycetota bacterium]
MSTKAASTIRLTLVALLVMAMPGFAQFDGLPDEPGVGRTASDGSTHEIAQCVVGLVNKIDLAAPEAGVLQYVGVKQGSRIKTEDVVARIDSREVEQAYKRATFEHQLAVQQAKDEIEIEYAEASTLVERADWEEVMQANSEVPGAVAEAEVRKEELEYRRAVLGGEKARKDQELAYLQANVKRAEMKAALIAIEKREVRAPFDGEVLNLLRDEGEWVQPGDTIAEIAQLDLLQVDGWVYFDEFDPREIENCRVTIDVRVGRNRMEQATGYIVYVDPIAEPDGRRSRYRVRAEISNRLQDGRWLISPNLTATMRIHLGTASSAQVGGRSDSGRSAK